MHDRKALLQALETITTARRHAQAELDEARAALLAAAEQPANEELIQTLGALVRQLDTAVAQLTDAIRTVDHRERVLARHPTVG